MRFAQPARPSRQIQCWSKNWALGEESHCASTNALSLRSTQRLASPQHSATESSVTENAIDSSEKGAEQGADRLAYEAAERLRTVAAYKAVIQHFPESVYGKLAQESIRLLAENGTLEAVEAILHLTRTDRQMIQIGLTAQGFSPGPANGMFGPEMRTSLRSWQTASGHVPTGWLTREEANALKEAGAEAYRAEAKTGRTFRDCVGCPWMVVVPEGSFVMGSTVKEWSRHDEGPLRQITIGQPLAVGKFEITRGEFARFVEVTQYNTGNQCSWRNPGFSSERLSPGGVRKLVRCEGICEVVVKNNGKALSITVGIGVGVCSTRRIDG